ncbi:MAG: hypothetical protein HYZ42_18510 [Bacteroidetes bacterium]|nr:hypothetical protein [Bacteroidota bacterium]
MKKIKNKMTWLGLVIATGFAVILFSCGQPKVLHPDPKIVFKTGSNYVASGSTVSFNSTVHVGIVADTADFSLRELQVSQEEAPGKPSVSVLLDTYTVDDKQKKHYEKDYNIVVGSTTGKERYRFTIIDEEGYRSSVDITLNAKP